MRSPSRVTVGSSFHFGPWTGSSKAWFSIRIVPRRMVWQRMTPVSTMGRVQQERRKAPLRCRSSGPGFERHSRPSVTSTTHSLHFPCLLQEVGTGMPRASALVKSEMPGPVVAVWPLKWSSTLMAVMRRRL